MYPELINLAVSLSPSKDLVEVDDDFDEAVKEEGIWKILVDEDDEEDDDDTDKVDVEILSLEVDLSF